MLALNGCDTSRETIRYYQSCHLGRAHSNTLLSDLMSIPKPKLTDWGHDKLLPQFLCAADYYETCKPKRIEYLKSFFAESKPAITICYGGTFRTEFKQLFNGFKFTDHGALSIARSNNQIFIIGNLLSHRTMNEEIHRIAQEAQPYYS